MSDPKKPADLAPWSQEDQPIQLDRVEAENVKVFTADPATFFVVMAVLNRVRESVSEFQKLFADRPELQVVFDKALLQMAKAKIVDVAGDRIIVLRKDPYLDLRGTDFNFIPKLLGIAASRVRQNYVNDSKAAWSNGDDLSWRNLPDHPKVRQRLVQITNRYLAEIDKLQNEIEDDPEITGEKVRFCLIVNTALEQEDF